MPSDPADLTRYHRQMLLPGVGEAGQRRLLASHAVVVGCGALGCAIADMLCRAGVGRLTLIDRDVVELTNLQRQTLFTEADAAEGLPKAEAARRRLAVVNGQVAVEAVIADLTWKNAERLLPLPEGGGRGKGWGASAGPLVSAPAAHPPTPSLREGCSILLDGTDNFETRYLINDFTVKHGLAYAYGGAVGAHGMQATFTPGGPCLRCLFPEPPPPGAAPTCDTAGVWGPVVQIVAACQAADAMRVLLGEPVAASLLDFDLWAGRRRRLDLGGARDPACPCCGGRRFEFLSGERSSATTGLCGQRAVQVSPERGAEVDLASLRERLSGHGSFTATPFLVRGRFDREVGEHGPCELTVFADGRAIVGGTSRPEFARAIYARYVGG